MRAIGKVPSCEVWDRKEFTAARAKQMEAERAMPRTLKIGSEDVPVELIETEYDEIVCDSCNAEITEDRIQLVNYGRRVACAECWKRWYAQEPMTFRELMADGSLGKEVT